MDDLCWDKHIDYITS